jgi:hypothetical protein
MDKFGEGFVWIGATFCFIGATLTVIGATSAMIGATNQLFPNSDGITGLKKWLRFDFGATLAVLEQLSRFGSNFCTFWSNFRDLGATNQFPPNFRTP